MRKKNLTKAVETTVAPNPKEVDIWVEPKDDDTVSLKYYDYHDDEWKGGSDSNGNEDFPLLQFYDGTSKYCVLDLKNNTFSMRNTSDFKKDITGQIIDGIPVYYIDSADLWDGKLCSRAEGVSRFPIEIVDDDAKYLLASNPYPMSENYYTIRSTTVYSTATLYIFDTEYSSTSDDLPVAIIRRIPEEE